MKIKINIEKFKLNLEKQGLDNIVCDKVVKVLHESCLPFIIEPTGEFIIDIGNGSEIKLLNSDGEPPKETDVLSNGYFEAKIGGLDSNRIKSIELPKLSYEVLEVFTINVDFFPFELPII
jgi:hypothetical protein